MANADVQRVIEAVDPARLTDLAAQLIAIPSFKGEETACSRFLVGYLKGRGFEAELQEVEPGRFNAIGRLRGTGGGRSLMLNGHLDIDPLGRAWRRDPWTPSLEGRRLYGAGIGNMKAGVASMVAAADAVHRSGVRLAGDIVIAGVVGELQGGVGSKFLAENGPRADMAIVPEPYGADDILTVAAGMLQGALHVLGRSRWVGSDEREGVDALEMAAKAAAALRATRFTFTPRADLPGLPRLIVSNMIAGVGRDYDLRGGNVTSDFATMIFDVRFQHSQTPQSVEEDLRRALAAVRLADPRFEYELEIPAPPRFRVSYVMMPPFELPDGEYILEAMLRAYRAVTGKEPRTPGGARTPQSYSGNDTGHLLAAGIPCVLYGPAGGNDQPEASDQYVDVGEMEQAARVMAAAAVDICSQPNRIGRE